jgi:hypothetical protein
MRTFDSPSVAAARPTRGGRTVEACIGFILVLFALAVVIVVGHFLWRAIAAAFRAMLLSGDPATSAAVAEQPPIHCALCDSWVSTHRQRCPVCRLDQQCYDAEQLREIKTAIGQIANLKQAGDLPAAEGDTVLRALERRRLHFVERLNIRLGRVLEAQRAPLAVPAAAVESATVTPQLRRREEEIAAVIPMLELAEVPAVEPVPPAPPEPVIPAEPPPPRRSFAEMMAGFMEERNILWGELVGGLLIVGCSIALVISLRQTLEEIPYFPFLIVAAVTAGLIGAGRYTLSHWKLESTSRGLLVIGTMLVPLSFMVLAGLTGGRERGLLEAGIEAAAIALFTWLVRGAANVVVRQPVGPAAPRPDWLVTAALLGASASLLLVPHIEEMSDPSNGLLGLVGYLPAMAFVLTQAVAWAIVYRRDGISPRQAGGLFLALGLSVYAVAVAFVFLLCRTENAGQALEYLAVPVALAGLPLLIGGTVASAKLRDAEADAGGLPRGIAAVIATMLSLGGTLILLLALAAAWPHPVRLIVIGAIDCAVLSFVALRFRLTPAYVPAQICLAVAVLTGYHALVGHLDGTRAELGKQLVVSWLSPESSVVLLMLASLLAVLAEFCARKLRLSDSRYLLSGAGVAAFASLLLVAVAGRESPGRAACVFGACAAGAWLVNARWRLTWLTSVAAAVLFGALVFVLRWSDAEMPLSQTLTWSLLADAGVVLLLALAVDRATKERIWKTVAAPFRVRRPQAEACGYGAIRIDSKEGLLSRGFVVPLQDAALTASVAAAFGLFAALRWDWLLPAAVVAIGCGGVWLILAWRRRQPVLFAALQGALAVAVMFGCVRALQTQAWFTNDLVGLLAQVRSWQAYGVGLSALGLAWVLARFGLQRSQRAWALVEPGWQAVDRLLLGGLVVLAVVVTSAGIAAGVGEELTPLALNGDVPTAATATLHVHGPLGWCWLGVLALTLGLTLWQGKALSALPGLTALALCAGVTAAAAFADGIAVASAVRWSLAICFVVLSVLLWLRGRLGHAATVAGIRWERGPTIATVVRALLIAGAMAPVLLLTAAVAGIGFARMQPSGPLAGSFFANVGVVVNNLTPLVLLSIGLAGHGIRERSGGYAFAAGQVLLLAVVGGYALGIITGGGSIGSREAVQLGQLATATTAVWLLGWLAVRRFDTSAEKHRGVMLAIQDGLTLGSHLLWLVPALALLAFPDLFPTVLDAIPFVKWEAGSWLGWVVVGLAVAAGTAYRLDGARAVPSWFVALAAVLVAGLFCCTVAIYAPAWDQRALMLVAALLSLGFVWTLVQWSGPTPVPWLQTSKDSLAELAPAGALGALVVILALVRSGSFDDWYWSAAAVAVVAASAVSAALLRRGEGWMFVANLLAMLASALVVCGAVPAVASATWLVLLLQVNLATAGVVGLFWLACRRRIYAPTEGRFQAPVCLYVQHVLTCCGNLALLCLASMVLVFDGGIKGLSLVLAAGDAGGWLALLPAAVGAVWLLRVFAPRHTLHALAGSGLMAGALAACSVTRWDLGVLWLGHHVLSLTWLLVAAGVVVAAWVADSRRATLSEESPPWWTELVPPRSSVGWVSGIGAAVVLLAFLSGWTDPYRPYWPCGVVLAVSVLAGALAVWRRRGDDVYASGLLFNVVGHLAWWSWAETAVATDAAIAYRLVLVHVICFALASLVWSAIELVGRRVFLMPVALKHLPPFRHLAAWAAVGFSIIAVGSTLAADVGEVPLSPHDTFVWFALVAILAAAVATLGDKRDQRWAGPLPQLYALGLLVIANVLHETGLPAQWLGWIAAVLLGPYALVASLVCWLGLRDSKFPAPLAKFVRPGGWPLAWFVPAQIVVSGVAAVLAVWICLTFTYLGPRLASFWAVACLVPAWALLTPAWDRLSAEWRLRAGRSLAFLTDATLPRLVALLLGVLAAACLHCAIVPPDYVAPWLHRSVLLMAAVTWMSALYGLLLPRLLPADSGWSALARRLATPLGVGACGLLLVVLAQEFASFNPDLWTTSLVWPGVVVVAVALAVLIVGALTFAVSPARDVFKLSDRRRTLYVYAAEVLLVLFLVHLRLNLPFIVPAYLWRCWVFGIMAVAFVGVGLSEICKRRGLRVLADPFQRTAMLLPVLPLAAFMLLPLGRQHGDIDWMSDDYRWHASIWFMMGVLYLIVALTRRSSHLALAAAVLANFGLWVLFGHHDQVAFLVHPQLWLIPVGLIVLAAERLNHDRLQPAQALALRYAGLLLIYLSSTADMFITGLGQNVALPILLALLAVAGVLLGILLRVRAFLFLGVTFLFLVVFSQIWHAAVDRAQTWVWWASGLVLGIAILTLFALLEKRRNDVLKMLAEIKRWQ